MITKLGSTTLTDVATSNRLTIEPGRPHTCVRRLVGDLDAAEALTLPIGTAHPTWPQMTVSTPPSGVNQGGKMAEVSIPYSGLVGASGTGPQGLVIEESLQSASVEVGLRYTVEIAFGQLSKAVTSGRASVQYLAPRVVYRYLDRTYRTLENARYCVQATNADGTKYISGVTMSVPGSFDITGWHCSNFTSQITYYDDWTLIASGGYISSTPSLNLSGISYDPAHISAEYAATVDCEDAGGGWFLVTETISGNKTCSDNGVSGDKTANYQFNYNN